jgi:ankyrin repeat protein
MNKINSITHINADAKSADLWNATYKGDVEGVKTAIREMTHDSINNLRNAKDGSAIFILNKKNIAEHTPLHYASQEGYVEIVRTLLKCGANPNVRDYDWKTALHFSCAKGYEDISELLLANDANVNNFDRMGSTPLIYAAWKGSVRTVENLLNKGAQVDLRDNDASGYTPLHYATLNNHVEVVQKLLDFGANVHLKCWKGQTAYDIAVKHNFISLITLLESHAGKN